MKYNSNNISRRDFVTKAGLIAIAVSVSPVISCKDDDQPVASEVCNNTTPDILGPFYKAGAPFQEDITSPENEGAPLFIKGNVFGDCGTRLKNAIVEIWNSNANGEYDNETFKFRGRFKTTDDGLYRFKTIVPGRYLNGGTYRPSHIHFRITAPGFQELVSQIYFKDDPFISQDPWAGDPKASERILPIGKDANGTDTVTFDIFLTPLS
jgi:protocatechuate 3,4-dioxygenase beta subunit